MIAWFNEGEKPSIDLLIEPRNGFTRKLFDYAAEYNPTPLGGDEKALADPMAEPSDHAATLVEGGDDATFVEGEEASVDGKEGSSDHAATPGEGDDDATLVEGEKPSVDGKEGPSADITKGYQNAKNKSNKADPPFGFSRQREDPMESDYLAVIFSGPHGMTYPVHDYAKLLLFAEGFGIAAIMPFLKGVHTHHIYIYWQLDKLGKFSLDWYAS